MKNFTNYINDELETLTTLDEASLLDLDDIMSDSDAKVLDKYAETLFDKYPVNERGKDAYGRELNPGDWVICVPPGSKAYSSLKFGIVKRIAAKRITISIATNTNNASWISVRTNKARFSEATMDVSVDPCFTFKIVDKEEFIKTLK